MDHMSMAEYKAAVKTLESGAISPDMNVDWTITEESVKRTRKMMKSFDKISKNNCPLESVESSRLAGELTRLVTLGKVVKFSHIANESKDYKANVRNKQIGVRAGCPDFVCVLPDKIVFIELKRQHGGTVSDEQKQWIEAINRAGGYATVAKGATEAIEYLESLIVRI